MVELLLEPEEDHGLPGDCFVSVRIGDVQKLSRLTSSRLYRFPDNAGASSRRARVEVFRRIGQGYVNVDPLANKAQKLMIDCSDFGNLGLQVGVVGGGNSRPTPGGEEEAPKYSKKVRAAKEYLNKHNLEVQLADAMQGVLRERPDNPHEFIASKLLSLAGPGPIRLSPVNEAPRAARVEPSMDARAQRQAQKLGPEHLAVRKAPDTSANAFRAYYRQHVQSIPQRSMAAIHVRFLAKVKDMEPATNALPFKAYYAKHVQCLPLKALAKVHRRFPAAKARQGLEASTKTFRAYYTQHIQSIPSTGFATLHSRFPAKAKARQALEASAKTFRAYYTQQIQNIPSTGFATLHSRFPAKAKARQATEASAKTFPAYYTQHIQSIPPTAFARLQSRFPAKVKARQNPPSGKTFRAYYTQHIGSNPSPAFDRIHNRFPATVKEVPQARATSAKAFRAYYSQHMQSLPAAAFETLQSRFPAMVKAKQHVGQHPRGEVHDRGLRSPLVLRSSALYGFSNCNTLLAPLVFL